MIVTTDQGVVHVFRPLLPCLGLKKSTQGAGAGHVVSALTILPLKQSNCKVGLLAEAGRGRGAPSRRRKVTFRRKASNAPA
ncbi:hypothetical protein SLG_35950 [Sphingobium sp. SYK-6]|nr:hypothetical protein SLG_35950 [Sphingobium sp. SYK-6]